MKKSLGLKFSILAHRLDPLVLLAAGLVFAALLIQLLLIPELERRQNETAFALANLQAQPGTEKIKGSSTQVAIAAFENVLTHRVEIPLILEKQFEIARQYRIELGRGEYRLDKDSEGGFSYYRITLPVSGPYSALRPFAESILAEWPGMALEQLSFSRGHAGETETEAVLRFALLVSE